MSRSSHISFAGQSGARYRFRIHQLGTRFKPVGGVCILTRRSAGRFFGDGATHECIHIGETADLSTLAYNAPYFASIDCLCILGSESSDFRRQVVDDLALKFEKWNDRCRISFDAAQ